MLDFPEGSKIGNYTIARPLGAGGMAVVLLCDREGMGGFKKRYVAKLIHPNLTDDEQFVRMFLDEARLCANLQHQNVVQVFEIDAIDGVPFLIMEYVDGPSMAKLVREAHRQGGPLHYGYVARMFAGVCRGLHHAHTFGGEIGAIVHRDVSLQNILVTTDGTPKLIDFGIAKADGRLEETQTGQIKGKLQYMAPEQLNQGIVDARSDLYAVGVCLYKATTGRYPFEGSDQGTVIAARLENKVPKPSDLVAGYPAELEHIVLGALKSDPKERTASAAEMAQALESFSSYGAWSCKQEELANWITRLFPGGADQYGKLSKAELQTSSELLSRLTAVSTIPAAPAPVPTGPSRAQLVTFGALGLGGLLLVVTLVAGVVWGLSGGETVQSDNEAAAVFLDEAEAALAERDFRLATQLLTRCSQLKLTDAKVTVRLERLTGRAQRELGLGLARRLLGMGQPDEALAAVRELLDQDPNDADALAILDEIVAAREGKTAAVAPADPGTPPEPQKTPGTLEITGPDGAALFVDDVRVGALPVRGREIPTGRHVLHVRKQGFEAWSQEIDVDEGEKIELKATLTEAKQEDTVAQLAELAKAEIDPVPPTPSTVHEVIAPAQPTETHTPTPTPTPAPTEAVVAPVPAPVAPAPVAPAPPAPAQASSVPVHYTELSLRVAPRPAYPAAAAEQNLGDVTCLVKVWVDTDGRVTEASVSNCPEALAAEAKEATSHARFLPPVVGGKKTAVVTTMPVKFTAKK